MVAVTLVGPFPIRLSAGNLIQNTHTLRKNKKNYNMILSLSCYKKGRATVFTDINF